AHVVNRALAQRRDALRQCETLGITAQGSKDGTEGRVMPRRLLPEVQRALVRAREDASVAGASDAVEVSAKRPMAVDRGERSGFAHEDPRRVEGLTGRGNPFVTVGGGPGPAGDGACEYAAGVVRGASVGVAGVALG